jgi:hypothetical protein
MQRRAAAIYFVFFLAIAVGAWSYIGVAENAYEPQFSVDGTTFQEGSTATIDGVEYEVTELGHAGGGGGGHGGGGGGDLEATLSWTDPSAPQTTTLDNGSTIDYRDGVYNVTVFNQTAPPSVLLREDLDVQALLAADDSVEDDLAEQNGTLYVVDAEDRSLRPLSEWLPEPETATFSAGDEIEYENQTATVAAIERGGVTLEWEGSVEEETDLTEGTNVTLANGERYFAHFPAADRVTLAPPAEYPAYSQTVAERDYFGERLAGLWGVVIIAGMAALVILALAYLPTRG